MLDEYGVHLEFLSSHLPDGMRIAAQAALYEPLMEWLLGYEGLFYATYDQPDLVDAVFNAWGELVEASYSIAASIPGVGVIWHGDDLGYKTATLLSPQHLRRDRRKHRSKTHKCGLEVVCVTHQVGFYKPGEDEMPPEMRRKLYSWGVAIHPGVRK